MLATSEAGHRKNGHGRNRNGRNSLGEDQMVTLVKIEEGVGEVNDTGGEGLWKQVGTCQEH